MLFASDPQSLSQQYQRYLLSVFRDNLPFSEVPIKLYLRKRAQSDQTDEDRRQAGKVVGSRSLRADERQIHRGAGVGPTRPAPLLRNNTTRELAAARLPSPHYASGVRYQLPRLRSKLRNDLRGPIGEATRVRVGTKRLAREREDGPKAIELPGLRARVHVEHRLRMCVRSVFTELPNYKPQ